MKYLITVFLFCSSCAGQTVIVGAGTIKSNATLTSGSPLGNLLANGSDTSLLGVNGALVATAFPGSDICAQVTNAEAALPATGGRIIVPAGVYSPCAGSGGIGIAINVNGVTLEGEGWLTQLISTTGPTTIQFASGVTGIDITKGSVTVKDLDLLSQSTGAGSDDGIRVRGGPTTLDSIGVSHFGHSGIMTQGDFPTNADSWRYSNIQSYGNYGDGFLWQAPCTDNHLGVGELLSASVNGAWGFNMLCGVDNTINSPLAQGNKLGDYNVQSSYNTWNQVYCETGAGSVFVLGSGSPNFVSSNHVSFSDFGQCATISNSGATHGGQRMEYFGPDNWLVWNGLWISGEPGATGNRSYEFNVGSVNPGNFGVFDYTDSLWLFNFDPTARLWIFDQKMRTTPTATTAGFNVGSLPGDPLRPVNGDIWYNSATNKFRCFENGATANCMGGDGGNRKGSGETVTHTAGALNPGKLVIGNAGADITVDPGVSSDGAGNIRAVSYATTGGGAFSSLPKCAPATEGQLAKVTDSTTNTWGATITGGAGFHVMAYCDGSNWTVAAK
jgi:hypothetical protein